MRFIDKLIELCPCEVEFGYTEPGYNGYHCYKTKQTASKVVVANYLSEDGKLAILAHETSHVLCEAKGCKCTKQNDRELKEFHAYEFCLQWLFANKCKQALKWQCGEIERLSKFPDDHYTRATKRIMKLKLWEKCKEFANS